jgi:hypothetical protein
LSCLCPCECFSKCCFRVSCYGQDTGCRANRWTWRGR